MFFYSQTGGKKLALLSRNWWLFVLRGAAAVLFGILTFLWPGTTVTVMVLLFGLYALVDGTFAVFAALTNTAGNRRWWVLFEGLVSIGVGILTFIWPGLTAISMLYLIAIWAVVTGILEILAAIELRREISNEWMLILSGIASVAFGVLVILFPGAGVLSVIWMIAAYAVVFGLLVITLGFRVRNLATPK